AGRARLGAEALEARLLDTRLDLEPRDGERRRVGERLPVAVAELQLDRAVAQAKAEALVAVEAVVLARVAREGEAHSVGGRGIGEAASCACRPVAVATSS